MIFNPWVKYKTKKSQKENRALRKSVGYKEANNFGIIFNNDEQSKIEAADKLISLLKMDGKNIKTIAFERKNSIKHLPYDTFTINNFSFWGNLIGKPINDFTNAKYDFLICLDEQPNLLIRNILANSKAKCRIGRYDEINQPTFEMLLQNSNAKDQDWVDSMYQYLRVIY